MESSVFQYATFKTPPFLPPPSQPRQLNMKAPRQKMRCNSMLSESLLGDNLITDEELVNLEKRGSKCRKVRGVAELLECLECEAIMGEDSGKDPGDYDRRAQILDKSSKVFQALKYSNNFSSPVVD